MKRALLVVLLVVGLDQGIGFLLNRLYLHTTSGERGGVINGVLRQNSDVLVLGSSRARHHVMPVILGERLSLSVFNAGLNGHDFLYAVMLFDLWTRSHPPPKVILLNIDPKSLVYSKEELDRTSVFSAYFYQSERIHSILLMRGKYEWLKYLSSSYRFNGKVLPMIKSLVMGLDNVSDGYIGLEGSLPADSTQVAVSRKVSDEYSAPFWDLKLNYLSDLARYCTMNGTRLILFHSPRFREDPAALAAWLKRVSALQMSYEGVEFLDLDTRELEIITSRPDLFMDRSHMNARGAEMFSRLLADELARHLGSMVTERQ